MYVYDIHDMYMYCGMDIPCIPLVSQLKHHINYLRLFISVKTFQTLGEQFSYLAAGHHIYIVLIFIYHALILGNIKYPPIAD